MKKLKNKERLGSVNLRADEETKKYQDEIKKMEDDRADLYSAIVNLKHQLMNLIKKVEKNFLMLIQKLIENLTKFIQNYLMVGMLNLELVDSDDPFRSWFRNACFSSRKKTSINYSFIRW